MSRAVLQITKFKMSIYHLSMQKKIIYNKIHQDIKLIQYEYIF